MEITDVLKKLSLDKSSVFTPASDFKLTEKGVCSLFLIDVEKGRKAYRYDVDIVNVSRGKSLAKGADDGQRALNRNICYEMLTSAYMKTNAFGMEPGGEVIYDCKSTMYTSKPVRILEPLIMIPCEEVIDFVKDYCGDVNFTVTITPNQAIPVLPLDDICQYITKESLYKEDRSVRTFLEMAITQFSINNNSYTMVGAGKLFETNPDNNQQAGNGIVLRSGVAKGVRVVHDFGNPKPALVLDTKVCAFYDPQSLLATILAITRPRVPRTPQDWHKIRCILQDVRVEVMYARHRSFGIGRLTEKPMSALLVGWEGGKIPMPLYFEKRYNIRIEYPDFPAVIPNTNVQRGKPLELFPIEQLMIMEDQRVPIEKMDKNLSAKLLKANSIRPNERLDKIMRHANELGVFNPDNAVLRAFGIRVLRDTNEIVIGVRRAPRIRFANNHIVEPSPDMADWRKGAGNAQYIDTSEIRDWIILCDHDIKPLVNKFVGIFMIAARKKGLAIMKQPIIATFGTGSRWMETFERIVDQNVEYVLLIDSKEEDTHGLLKYYEALYKVITQHITTERVVDIVQHGKMQTLENILNKTNCKNFGLNYEPVVESSAIKYELSNNETLIVGYDVAHPPPVSAQDRRLMRAKGLSVDSLDPSVVGICANMARNPHAFVGDYFYQESRKESVDINQLSARILWILDTLSENRPEVAFPKYLFVLRDGLSEGQFAMAVDEELKAIKRGCLQYSGGTYLPQILFVIGTKRHFKKFFANRNGAFQNLAPGSVITDRFTREDCPEFFMQSHYPLKGVGKPVEYSVVVDEIGVSQDELQGLLNALCYSHQIVNSAVSLPEPIYQADELAKRGLNNYITMKRLEDRRNPIPRGPNRLVDPLALTSMLSYKDSKLKSTRFTA